MVSRVSLMPASQSPAPWRSWWGSLVGNAGGSPGWRATEVSKKGGENPSWGIG